MGWMVTNKRMHVGHAWLIEQAEGETFTDSITAPHTGISSSKTDR